MDVDLRLGALDHAAAVRLITQLNDEIRARYDEPVEDFYFTLILKRWLQSAVGSRSHG